MKYLNLPVAKTTRRNAKHLSMNDYLRFVINNLKYSVDIDAVRKDKSRVPVNVPFVMK